MILWLTIVIVIIALIGWMLVEDGWVGLQFFCLFVLLLGGSALVVMSVLVADSLMSFPATVLEIEEVKRTIEQARLDEFGDIERATLQTEILQINQKIARAKYWRQNKWTYIFYHPGVMELEPLR